MVHINHLSGLSSISPRQQSAIPNPAPNTDPSATITMAHQATQPQDTSALQFYSEQGFEGASVNFNDALQIKQSKQAVLGNIQSFASGSPDGFQEAMRQVLGDKLSESQLAELHTQAQKGTFPFPENIRFVSDETLQGNKAAYSPDNGGTVFLAESLKENTAALTYALSEEIGHHLDATVGGPDSAGDEGQIFAQTLQNKGPIDKETLEVARLDNDKGVIKIDGKETEVEFIAPAVVAAAWWGAKVAATTAVDAALDITIAAVTGMPPPGTGTHLLNAISNAIPWLGEANTGKKIVKLGAAVEKAISTLNKLKRIPGGDQLVKRLDDLYKTAKQAFDAGDLVKLKNSLSSLINELGDAQKLARGVHSGTVKLISKADAPVASFTQKQLQKKHQKHATDFGITGNFNSANRALFEQKLKGHISKDSTIVIEGVYKRGAKPEDVLHYYDPQTQLSVMTDLKGNFISGWKLSENQREYLLTIGTLGGGS